MNLLTAEVNLHFHSMDRGYRVRVSPRQLFFLDLFAERRVEPDGTVSYILPKDARSAIWRVGIENVERSLVA